jgi:iron(III) transport system ATP-binding protein
MGATCSVRRVSKLYGDKRVVDDVSLEIGAGEFLVILGPSGCGKTTTLRMIAGLETPDAGSISIGGRMASDPERGVFLRPEQRDIGMVFQSYAIWPHMTVFENVAFPLRARGTKRALLRGQVEAVLETVGLAGFGGRSASALSGGQMQRVVLARALVYQPGMLLFDEPLSNLDLKMREHLRVELKQVQQRTGLTCVYVTHDQTEAVELADRIAVMNGGRVVQLGPPVDLYRRPESRFVAEFISSANIFPVIVDAALDGGLARVTAAGGGSFVAASGASVSPGDRRDVVVHPEECGIAPADRGEGIPVRITQRRFQGVSMRYTVDWNGAAFDVVVLGTAESLAEGSAALLRIPPGTARLLPPGGG